MHNDATQAGHTNQAADGQMPLVRGAGWQSASDADACSGPPPAASALAHVMQVDDLRHPLLAYLTIMGMTVAWLIWLANRLLDSKSLFWPVALMLVSGLAVMLGTAWAWMAAGRLLNPQERNSPPFMAEVLLRMDEGGVHVDGLGTLPWQDLVSYERHASALDHFQLQTDRGYALSIMGGGGEFEPVVAHYFSAKQALADTRGHAQPDAVVTLPPKNVVLG